VTVTSVDHGEPDRRTPTPPQSLVSPRELAAALGLPSPTPEQAAVIAAPPEPALVVAGAGAGKTETMAARVVWLVANRIVTPDRVLGLTFTRKAARQLAERVRSRLRRLAGSRLLDRIDPGGTLRAQLLTTEPTVLTYHAYAGRLVAEHGLRIPVEPGARLLSETAAWQLAHSVVSSWTEDLDTDKVPATVTGYVLRLAGELAEHLVDPEQVREHALAFCAAVEEAPRAPRQSAVLKDSLRRVLTTQRLRAALLPLVEAYTQRKRRDGVMDFADQMSLAARLALEHPEVVRGERERFGAVLLDEYQDTGHAQRLLLRALFGDTPEVPGGPLPVTAVGDPIQAIYGWRGASAANLRGFPRDFGRRRPDGRVEEAARYGMLTSFRNPPEVLAVANAVSESERTRAAENGLPVDLLRARPDAQPGEVRCALLPDVRAELDWLGSRLAARWRELAEERGRPPTAAVLVRRRADMAPVAAALRAHGLPVEVVGLGGLLDEPEVRDLVSVLRVLVDPLAGSAAARLLTGARWRLGAADLAALWQRAGELASTFRGTGEPGDPLVGLANAVPGDHVEHAGLVDAIDDPGPPERYSPEGYRRIRQLGGELAALRRRLDQPLPELVADVERTMRLDVEALAREGGAGRVHLDAFADVVTGFAATNPTAGLTALLDYLDAAERAEDGLEPGEVEVVQDRVQVLTAHAAKGLEWEIVAVPHVVNGVFPGRKLSSSWLGAVDQLPVSLRGDAEELPVLDLSVCADRKEVENALVEHEQAMDRRRLEEERRLFYVALTRAERFLLVSGHWWGETGSRPRGPSPFLAEVYEMLLENPWAGTVDRWVGEPAEEEGNPLTEHARVAHWPVDPLGERRQAVAEGAELVRAALAELGDADPTAPATSLAPGEDPEGWARDVDVLLAERSGATEQRARVELPDHLSVSQLVELAGDPEKLARRLRRPLPYQPNPMARRGTAFHAWLEQRFSVNQLLDLDELPGAADADAAPDEQLERLKDAFLASEWAERVPHEVEVPFETEIDGIAVRGRMDAVFADPDGGWTVVDWKTGAMPDEEHLPVVSVQLAAYRLAWAALSGTPLHKVRAAFHYVRHNRTLRPADLLDAEGLRALLRGVPAA